jgi:hypothetical protein
MNNKIETRCSCGKIIYIDPDNNVSRKCIYCNSIGIFSICIELIGDIVEIGVNVLQEIISD